MENLPFSDELADWSPWQDVDLLLAEPCFECLQKVDIHTKSTLGDDDSPAISREIIRWSPILGERDILDQLVVHGC